uniref:MINDY deubiquitinase domain-containing protein n=1 Tax=Oryza glaberrima TaxID=4538 RepID=I1QLN3_ORYGL
MERYRFVRSENEGKPVGLACHEAYSCSIALYNFALLTWIPLPLITPRFVTEQEVKYSIIALVEHKIKDLEKGWSSNFDYLYEAEKECKCLVHALPGGLQICPALDSITSFKTNGGHNLFSLLEIRMVHGWLANPEDNIYETVRSFSCDDLESHISDALNDNSEAAQRNRDASKRTTIHFYLMNTAIHSFNTLSSGLHRYQSLCQGLLKDEYAILYRGSDTFNLIREADEEPIYLNCKYIPLKNQPHIAKAKLWYYEKLNSRNEYAPRNVTKDEASIQKPTGNEGKLSNQEAILQTKQASDETLHYRVVQFKHENLLTSIICHKGYSLWTALYNHLVLNRALAVKPSEVKLQFLPEREVKDAIIAHLKLVLGEIEKSEKSKHEKLYNCEFIWKCFIRSTADTHQIYPVLDSFTSFKDSFGRSLICVLGIELVHGWVANPEDNIYETVKSFSSDDLESHISSLDARSDNSEAAQRDRDASKNLLAARNQFTSYGYQSLCQGLGKDEYAILYRGDDIFNLIREKDGSILILETDTDILDAYPNARWRILEEVDEEPIYLNCKYIPLKNQPHIAKVKRWYLEMKSKKKINEASSNEGAGQKQCYRDTRVSVSTRVRRGKTQL